MALVGQASLPAPLMGIRQWRSHEKYAKNMRNRQKYAKMCDSQYAMFFEDDSSKHLDLGIPIPTSGKF